MTAYDLLVVGAGVQGLWLARAASSAGMNVAVVEAQTSGTGASSGPLGALMPHVPTGWSEKKQLQFEGLLSIEQHAQALHEQTGIDPGYVRCGRAMPIRLQGFLDQFPSRHKASVQRWQSPGRNYELATLAPDALDGWLDPKAAELGIFWDPFAARIHPESYVASLKASLAGRCDVFENWPFAGFDAVTGRVTSGNGSAPLIAHRIILAAGYHSYDLVRQMTGLHLGAGVKGQAIVLSAKLPEKCPVLYDDGMYIVAHGENCCAVGSTTEKEWQDEHATDDAMMPKLEQARRLCPALRDAAVIGSWAAVRPKSAARDPIAGRLLPDQPVYIATGGFKITLGIAHELARHLIDGILNNDRFEGIPETFSPERHLAVARLKMAVQDEIA